jgi:hypothetical protein
MKEVLDMHDNLFTLLLDDIIDLEEEAVKEYKDLDRDISDLPRGRYYDDIDDYEFDYEGLSDIEIELDLKFIQRHIDSVIYTNFYVISLPDMVDVINKLNKLMVDIDEMRENIPQDSADDDYDNWVDMQVERNYN